MPFESMHIENFKSIETIDLELGSFNVLVGANASGKSNTISAFRFINYIMQYGLEDALSMMGGIENIINHNHPNNPLSLKFRLNLKNHGTMFSSDSNECVLEINSVDYSFSLKKYNRGNINIVHDSASINTSIFKTEKKGKQSLDAKTLLGSFTYEIIVDHDRKIKTETHIDDSVPESLKKDIQDNNIFSPIKTIIQTNKKELILSFISLFISFKRDGYSKVFDFNPKVLKNYSSVTNSSNLEENGSNLAFTIKHIIGNPKNKEKLLSHIQDILPFVTDIMTTSGNDGKISYSLKESYSKKTCLSNYISDGTADVIALIVALEFSHTHCMIFEEPENNIHPQLLSRVIRHMISTSEKTQIIITTHSPELINQVNIKDIFMVKREDNGQSIITKPVNSPIIQQFIENELNPGQLLIDGILGD